MSNTTITTATDAAPSAEGRPTLEMVGQADAAAEAGACCGGGCCAV
jgi:hypothetical protein